MGRIAINGFGRIGKMVVRAFFENGGDDLEIIAINDLGSPSDNVHLLSYDSVHGRFPFKVSRIDDFLCIKDKRVKMLSVSEPGDLPWAELGIDVVMECTGRFTDRDSALKHIDAGAKHVLISAPASNADITVVYGINHKDIKSSHRIISNSSCTTNCLAPVAFILSRDIGIEQGYMTTVHAYTINQPTVDGLSSDLRRARAAGLSLVPTTTGAVKAVALVIPELKGKIDGCAIRVPVANVSLIDFCFTSERKTSVEEINEIMIKASKEDFSGILDINSEPLVSIDFNHNAYSSVFDVTQTEVLGDRFCRVLSWYDNEWAFANRMLDCAAILDELG